MTLADLVLLILGIIGILVLKWTLSLPRRFSVTFVIYKLGLIFLTWTLFIMAIFGMLTTLEHVIPIVLLGIAGVVFTLPQFVVRSGPATDSPFADEEEPQTGS